MKKTMSALGAIFTAAALFITGCESPAMPDPIAAINDELNNANRTVRYDGNTFEIPDGTQEANINTITVQAPNGIYNVENAEFTITFTLTSSDTNASIFPDKDKLEASLEIKEVSANSTGTTANSLKDGSLPAKVVLIQQNIGSPITVIATVTVDLSKITYDTLLVHIKADTFTANNGHYRLNLDEDLTPGEREDDFYDYLTVTDRGGSSTPLAVITNKVLWNPRANINEPSVSFTNNAGLSGLFDRIIVTFADNQYPGEDYATRLTNNVKIDKYNAATGNWDAVALGSGGFARDSNIGTHSYTASFTSAEGDILRSRITGLDTWEETTNEYYGFKQKYTTKKNAPTQQVIGNPSFSTALNYTSGSIGQSGGVTVIGNTGETPYVKIALDTGATGTDKAATIIVPSSDAIKIIGTVDSSPVNIKWDSYSFEYETYADPNDGNIQKSYPKVIVLKLDGSYKRKGNVSFAVYITPKVTVGTGPTAKQARHDNLPTGFYTLGNVFTGAANKVTSTAKL
jgi:hypothetical protein